MNKCTKCGTEYEGNFCPNCGTASDAPKVCPRCSAELHKDQRFCSNCGYDLLGESSEYKAKQAKGDAALANNKTVRTALTYAPLVLFALWAALLWAFFAAPVIAGDGFLIENVTLYQLLKDEMMSDLFPVARALISFAAISCAYAAVFAVAQWKGNTVVKFVFNVASYLWHIAIIICAGVFAGKMKEFTDGLEDINGSFVAVVISLTAVFAVLQATATVLSFKGFIQKFNEEKDAVINNKVARIALKYAPLALFALWAALLWAFFAAPVIAGDGFLMENVNLYQLLKDETMSDLFPVARALISFAAISCAYAAAFAVAQWKGNTVVKFAVNVASYLWHVAIIICAGVFAGKMKEFMGDLEDENGSFVAVVISLTAVFAVLQAAATVLRSKFGIETLDKKELAAFKEKLKARLLREREINKRLRKEKIRCASAATITFSMLLCTVFLHYLGTGTLFQNTAEENSDVSIAWIYLVFYIAIAIAAGCFMLKKQWAVGLTLSVCQLAWSVIDIIFAAAALTELTDKWANALLSTFAALGFIFTLLPVALQLMSISSARKRIAKEYDAGYGGELTAAEQNVSGEQKPARKRLTESKTLRTVLKYAPLALFALWAMLLWALFAAPVTEGYVRVDGEYYIENVNLYQLLQDETTSYLFPETMNYLFPAARALISFAAISCAYAAAFAVAQWKGNTVVKFVLNVASYLCHVAIIICVSVFAGTNGSFVAVVISLTAVFALLQVAATVSDFKRGTQKVDEEKDAEIKNKIARTMLKYAPLTLFALWAVLLWALFAAPVMDGYWVNISLYQLLQKNYYDFSPIVWPLISFAAISCAYAVAFAVVQLKKGDCKATRVLNYVSYVWYAIIIALEIIFIQYTNICIVYQTMLFAVLQIVATELNRILNAKQPQAQPVETPKDEVEAQQ